MTGLTTIPQWGILAIRHHHPICQGISGIFPQLFNSGTRCLSIFILLSSSYGPWLLRWQPGRQMCQKMQLRGLCHPAGPKPTPGLAPKLPSSFSTSRFLPLSRRLKTRPEALLLLPGAPCLELVPKSGPSPRPQSGFPWPGDPVFRRRHQGHRTGGALTRGPLGPTSQHQPQVTGPSEPQFHCSILGHC